MARKGIQTGIENDACKRCELFRGLRRQLYWSQLKCTCSISYTCGVDRAYGTKTYRELLQAGQLEALWWVALLYAETSESFSEAVPETNLCWQKQCLWSHSKVRETGESHWLLPKIQLSLCVQTERKLTFRDGAIASKVNRKTIRHIFTQGSEARHVGASLPFCKCKCTQSVGLTFFINMWRWQGKRGWRGVQSEEPRHTETLPQTPSAVPC